MANHGKKGNVYKWNGTANDLTAEACTESGAQAQITDPARRILNPNADITFTDSGGANLIQIDYLRGIGYFDGNVTAVTVSGTGAYIQAANLARVGYMYGWSFEVSVETAEATVFQDDWKKWEVGEAEGSGSAEGFLASDDWFDEVTADRFLFLELFTYDPDNDGSGDHFSAWVKFSGFNVSAPIGELVKEKINFKIQGAPMFVLNV